MLSDNEKMKTRPPRVVRKKPGESNKSYSDEQKIELVKMYLLTGNLALSAATLKIPEVTARYWKAKEWWKQLEAEMRVQEDIQLSSRLKRIVEKSLALTEDRLENGDWHYNSKTGQMFRLPVAMKDAHKVSMDMVDKSQMLDSKQVAAPELENDVNKKLDNLAQKFAELANKVQEKPVIEVTDVIYVEQNKENDNDLSGNSVHGDADGVEEAEELCGMSDDVLSEERS